eukprot:gene5411-7161_t
MVLDGNQAKPHCAAFGCRRPEVSAGLGCGGCWRGRSAGIVAWQECLRQRGALPCSGAGRQIQRPPLTAADEGRRTGSKDKRPD